VQRSCGAALHRDPVVEGAIGAPWTIEAVRSGGGGCDGRTLDHRRSP